MRAFLWGRKMPLPNILEFIGTNITQRKFQEAQEKLLSYLGVEVPTKTELSNVSADLNAKITPKADKVYVDTTFAAYVGGRKAYTTLALAQADQANLPANTAIEVTNDPTSSNNGTYQWNGTTLTKSDYDPSSQSKNYTDSSVSTLSENIKELLTLDQTDKFQSSATTGVFGANFIDLANATLYVSGGVATVTSSVGSGVIQSIYTGRQILDAQKRTLRLKFKVEDVSNANGAAIFVGENIGILYSSNGVISVVDSAWAVQSSQNLPDVGLAFAANEEVTLEVQLNGDGSGVATATNASGYSRTLSFTGMQKGKVYLAVRRSFAGKSTTFESFSIKTNYVSPQNVDDALRGTSPLAFDNSLNGFFNSDTNARNINYKYSVVGGVLKLDTSGSNQAVYYAKNNTAFNKPSEFEVEFKINSASGTTGACIIIGDGADRKVFSYLSNGAIGLLNTVGGILDGSVHADMTYVVGQNVKIRLTVSEGEAIFTAIHPSGKKVTFINSDTKYGNVYIGWRGGATTADIYYLSKQSIPSSTVYLEKKSLPLSTLSKAPRTWKVLPDSTPNRSVKGFTCTGLAKITAGQFRGCWAVGDDGRLSEDVSSPYEPQIHILDGDFNRILLTIAGGYTSNSMQGVTFDTITKSHLWAACAGNNTVRKYSLAIGSEGVEVVEDRISMADLGLTVTPNAIAFDSTRGTGKGALWLSNSTGGTIYLIDCDPMAATRVIATITVANTVDHIQLIDGSLLYQGTSNGNKTTVYKYDIATNVESTVWADLEYWTAPEGLYYDKTWNTLYAINDGGFHNSVNSSPRFNCVLEYSLDF